MWGQDWRQYRKNLQLEREAWDLYEARRDLAKEETAEAIERKREEKERKKQELDEEFKKFMKLKLEIYHRKERWAHREYMRHVEKKFKTSVVIHGR